MQFILPLFILALCCGVFAQTNAEGCKLASNVFPLQERLKMIEYLRGRPLQMRVYGFVLDYDLELKFIAAFGFGLITQIIFREVFY